MQLKVREENVSQGVSKRKGKEGEGTKERGRGGGLGSGATGNMVMLQSTVEALKGC